MIKIIKENTSNPYGDTAWPRSLKYGLTPTRTGGSGTLVTNLQTSLNQLRFPTIIDGIFGPSTEKSVKQFQIAAILKPDGIVGKATWNKIEQALSGKIKIVPPVEKKPLAPLKEKEKVIARPILGFNTKRVIALVLIAGGATITGLLFYRMKKKGLI